MEKSQNLEDTSQCVSTAELVQEVLSLQAGRASSWVHPFLLAKEAEGRSHDSSMVLLVSRAIVAISAFLVPIAFSVRKKQLSVPAQALKPVIFTGVSWPCEADDSKTSSKVNR